ncbi:MAG: threonine synthase [Thermonema sp.]|uniref:threonine synthase n=1 Tax=Thermonema sp. TaxID=2231181 RepID=UPI0021DC89FB|nr:threonine synthase [Thermonema sp.]GIV38524.1 MAG: threonine synthase [Thermonema sp.]
MKEAKLICLQSGKEYPADMPLWCSEEGSVLDLHFSPRFPLERIGKRPKTLWRYWEALPIEHPSSVVSLSEGATPMHDIELEGKALKVKIEYMNPTGSFKDRGTAVLVSKLKEWGVRRVVEDSSGNAGASLAAYCAKAGIACDIFVPADTSPAKITQIKLYGAKVHLVKGTRDEVAQAAYSFAQQYHYASHVWHPFFFQGTKTFAYEVCEQLHWQAPDTVVVPAGNGSLLIGCYLGFRELKQAGIISKMPKLIGVQAKNCAPLYEAFVRGEAFIQPRPAKKTLAEGMSVNNPLRGTQMLQYVELSKGKFIAVEETEIVEMVKILARKGYFVEPTCAAVIAGARRYLLQEAQEGETVISVLTSTGLKAVDAIQKIIH